MKTVLTKKHFERDSYFITTAIEEIKDQLYFDSAIDEDDYFQIGYIALQKAVDAFEPKEGNWMTYARRVIKNAMIDYSKKEGSPKRSSANRVVSLDAIAEDESECEFGLVGSCEISGFGELEAAIQRFLDTHKTNKQYVVGLNSFLLKAKYPDLQGFEIAEMLGVTDSALRSARNRVKPVIQSYLKQYLR